MLSSVVIHGFSLLREVRLELGAGLAVITGESGAGKSLLFDAISFALGGRPHRSLLADGVAQCEVELGLELSQADAARLGAPWQAGLNTLARRLNASGRTRLTLNGEQASLEIAQAAAAQLFEITGQFESRVLFDTSSHLALLDEFGGIELVLALAEYGARYRELGELAARLSAAQASTAARAQEVDFLTYQIMELDKAAVQAGEAAEVAGSLRLAENAQQLQAAAGLAAELLTGGEDGGSAYDRAAQAQAQIDALCRLLDGASVAGIEPDELAAQLASALAQLEDAGGQCRSLAEAIQADPAEALRLRERMDLLHNLERKYGAPADELPGLLAAKQARLALLTDEHETPAVLEQAVADARGQVEQQGATVTKLRKQAVKTLVKTSQGYFAKLSFPQVELRVEQEPLAEPGPAGCDHVELLITLNPGEPARPLAQVASGGEASRLLLGLKAALAERRAAAVLLLDEVEAGLGGQAAESVAQVLSELAEKHQVLAISHLPVVAARAGQHLVAEKQVAGGRTSVRLAPADAAERKRELMRMVGGGGGAETAALAEKLLSMLGAKRSQA
jgi:DNA repair protein RecN (Recombination protein N)